MRWLVGFFLLVSPAIASTCENTTYLGASYTICEVAADENLQLFLRDSAGNILGNFLAVENDTGQTLAFGMNAGMFHQNREPVGHYIEDGIQETPVISSDGPGNFGMLPNGILCIADTLKVYETFEYLDQQPNCSYAIQSGPMLVINEVLHPRFLVNGTSKFIRNGVGTSGDGTRAVFAISNDKVNLHDFATLFSNRLALQNALYFDGNVSRIYAPSLNRSDFGWQLGPIVGVLN